MILIICLFAFTGAAPSNPRSKVNDLFCNLLLPPNNIHNTMDLHDAQSLALRLMSDANAQFQKVPGSAILLRYIKSSYQNDPVRSAVELFLFLFAVRYLLAPAYSTQKQKHVALTEEVRHFLCLNLGLLLKGYYRRLMNWLMTGLRSP